ncbi:MAG: zinc-dependent peptidase [Bacteroidetes bacterium]|nr:zinc-dependent peptidase [Bacteroidota bacterium]
MREYIDIHLFLAKNNAYYQKLNSEQKSVFVKRIDSFISSKSITGRQNFTVTPAVSVQIAAAAVQLTLGLETWDLSHFSQILVYPGEYKNPQTGKMHKGETNMGGFMCFSWKDFVSGNQTPDDKINLGLHEFGHALRFNGVRGDSTDYFFENYFKRWLACAAKEFMKMRKGLPSIFRQYGAVNINEFFSVVVETFFETPLKFKDYFPELYKHTSILLNQTFANDGSLILNCREELMKQDASELSSDFNGAIHYNLRYNGFMVMSALFFIVGFFSLSGQGYKYPPPYILFVVAAVFWFYLEKKYTRITFHKTSFTVSKGFLILKGAHSKTLPLSHLISLAATYEYHTDNYGNTLKQESSAFITYYRDGDFYEDELYCEFSNPKFEQLCEELSNNFVHIFIKD